MRLRTVAVSTALLAGLAAPGAASAATAAVTPVKPCYRAGTSLTFFGGGYTPNGGVDITSDGVSIGSATTNGVGGFVAVLTVGLASGERVKTYAATDQFNPGISASLPLRITALDVSLSPRSSRPGRMLRIRARGFTTGKRLYAHVVRGHFRRNIRVGGLKGACRKLKARKRLLSRNAHTGTYKVQFDTRRHYSRRTKVRVVFSVFIFRTFTTSAAGSASLAERWLRVR